ncbi:mechanosensitive ion channel family protein [Nocardioides campestrisoli]|uniref:mechanosensitive ion channel family protein n=1 Tax=Nocardioides campestrisoli TaxID=2736757 RepID=UPI00163DB497|nr:mechanosensitive ion channel family protein [Nocardioides campestrisoli]
MPALPLQTSEQTSQVCEDGQALCGWTEEATGNADLAQAADLLIGKPLTITLLVLGALLVRWVLHRLVDRVVRRAELGMVPDRFARAASTTSARLGRSVETSPRDLAARARRIQRAKTMGSLLKSIISGVVLAVAATMILSELGVNIAPIIASAGIVGLALGFGAQTLVKDFLSGIFMLIEDQYGVGDVVDLGEASGTVEAVSLRVTRLRDANGTVWYVRNGEILRVGNMSQNWARAVLDITVTYDADLVHARQVLGEVATSMWQDEDFQGRVIEEPEEPGVEAMTLDGITLRVSLKTAPMEQWSVARALRERVKARFDHEGIVIPHTRYVEWTPEAPETSERSGAPARSGAAERGPDREPVDGEEPPSPTRPVR